MILNPKIIKANAAIEKTKEQIVELQTKLKDLEKQKTELENQEIVALFRSEKLNEDMLAVLRQAGKSKSQTVSNQATIQPTPPAHSLPNREEESDVYDQ